MTGTGRANAVAVVLVAAALYLGCGLFVTYPAWLSWDYGVIGDWRHPDMISNHWMYRWVAETLAQGDGAGLLHNDRYYVPVGDSPVLAGNGSDAVLYGAAARVLRPLAAWPGGVTAWVLGIIVLNGLSGLALARSAGARWAGSLFAGSVLALSPYLAHELSGLRLAQLPVYPFAFFLAAWLRMLQQTGRARLVCAGLAGVAYALTALLYWYYGLWAALVGAALFLLWQPLSTLRARPWPALGAFLAVSLPPVIAGLAVFLGNWGDVVGADEAVFPHPLAIESGLPVTFPFYVGSVERRELALSLVLVGLAGLGAWHRRTRETALWGGIAVAFLSLAWGPELLLPSGASTGVPGPFQVLYGLHPTLQRYWWPYRHLLVTTLALLPLAAHAVDRLGERAGAALEGSRGKLAMMALTALVLTYARAGELDFRGALLWTHVSWWDPPVAYTRVADLPGDALFELPVAPQICSSQQTLSYQWVHGKRMANGHAQWVDRVRPDAWDDWVEGNSFLSRVAEFERGQLFGPFAFKPEDVVAVRDAGVRHLVVNAEYFPRELYPLVPAYRQIFTELFGEPVFVFRDQIFVWDLERYRFAGMVDAPEFRLPPSVMESDGSHMLDLGHNRPQGWRTMARLFPPVLPTAADVPMQGAPQPGGATQQPGVGAVPDAPGQVAPHAEAPRQ